MIVIFLLSSLCHISHTRALICLLGCLLPRKSKQDSIELVTLPDESGFTRSVLAQHDKDLGV